jgi:hypothetical protein
MEHKQANDTRPTKQRINDSETARSVEPTKRNCGRKRIYETDEERREAKLRQTAESNRRKRQQRQEVYKRFTPLQHEVLKILSNKALPFYKCHELWESIKKEDPYVQEYYAKYPTCKKTLSELQQAMVKKMSVLHLSYDQCCDICDIIEGTKSVYAKSDDFDEPEDAKIKDSIIDDSKIEDLIDGYVKD